MRVIPGSPIFALYSHNPDHDIWLAFCKEEYNGLYSNYTFVVISKEEGNHTTKFHGIKVVHLCIL